MLAGSPAGPCFIVFSFFFIFAGLRLVGQEIQKERRNKEKYMKLHGKKEREIERERERERERKKKRKKKERGRNREVGAQKNKKKHYFSWEIRFLRVSLFSVCF